MGIQRTSDFDVPPDEAARLRALLDLRVLDTADEERFDRITRLAARLFGVPIALVSLIDAHRQWAKSCIGLDDREMPRGHSICARALLGDDQLVVEDLSQDPLFAGNPLVTAPDGLRFYAGHVLRAPGGHRIGTLCVSDRKPRRFDAADRAALADLGALAERELANTEVSDALREASLSEQRLRAVMDGVADGVVVYGEDGLIQSVNPAAEEIFGFREDQMLGRVVTTLLDEVSWPLLQELLRGDGQSIVGHRMEVTALRADGRRFPLEIATGKAQVGGRALYVAVGRDVTGRKAAERQLSRARRRNQLLLESAGEGILGVDAQGTVLFVNPSFVAMTGHAAEELVGKRLDAVVRRTGPEVPDFEDSPVVQTLRDGRTRRFERRFVHTDGADFPAEIMVAATARDHGDDDDLAAAVLVVRDITQRYEVDRMKHEFVSVVGHELRTPLTSIRGSLGLIAGGVMGPLSADAQRMLDIAVQNTDRLVRLINDILDLERIESGKVELELSPQPARALLEATEQVVAAAAAEAGVTLRIEADDELVLGDRDRLVQALTNLVGNAVKFSPEGGEVLLRAECDDDEVRFVVRDRGRGIPADRLERIFERFEQVDASDARDRGGTGLGLPIARSIADQHSGRLWAEQTPGGGATFVIALQRLRAPTEGRRAVLLAGGDDRARQRVQPVLSRAGYVVVGMSDPGPFAAVVVAGDPAEAADDLARLTSRPQAAEVPIVFVGSQEDDELVNALECAVPAFAPKRVLVVEDDVDLGKVLVRMLERHGARVELVRTGVQAIAELDVAPPDLLVLDLVLPQGDGFSVVDHLRARGADVARMPLVVYTALELGTEERERLQTGRTRIMTKGFSSPADVEMHVLRLLEALP
ncbi:MAG TPA: PAS domain S-box protein [Solirubrobacteraceae bacterium]|nr:PAS domain S-box protein [Solirubrobacteraceae bacterium]